MRLTKLVSCMFVLAMAMTTVVNAQSGGEVAKVNGVPIPQTRLDLMIKAAVAQGQPDSAEMRNTLRENLIAEEILAQEAIKKGLDRDSDVKTQIDLARQAVLIRAYQADYIRSNQINEAELRKEYETVKVQMGDQEYNARHILVETEKEAKDIIAQIKKKAPFAKLAKDHSIDNGSKEKGGELGWTSSAVYVKPFADALQNLKKGQMTQQPVQTSFGWHVIQLDDVRKATPPSFEEVRQNMEQRILQRNFAATVEALRKAANVQ